MCPLPYVLLSLSRILVTQSQRPFQVSFGEDTGYERGELDGRIGLVASIVVISFPDRFPKAVNVVAIVAQKGPVLCHFLSLPSCRRADVLLCVFLASSYTYGGCINPDFWGLEWLRPSQISCSQSFSRSNPSISPVPVQFSGGDEWILGVL